MKKVYLLVFLYLVLNRLSYSQSNSNSDFRIHINEWAMFVDNNFEITQDSINVRKSSFGLAGDDIKFKIAIPENGRQKIASIVKAVNFKELEYNYERTSVHTPGKDISNLSDHDYVYDVILQHKDDYKIFRISSYKLDFFYELIKQVNLYLPDSNQLHYNDEYLKK